jgi:hypothetical protein
VYSTCQASVAQRSELSDIGLLSDIRPLTFGPDVLCQQVSGYSDHPITFDTLVLVEELESQVDVTI